MRCLCVNCSYIYDEAMGEESEGVKSGTKLCDLSDSFTCPVCGDSVDSFQEIIDEINYINPKDLSDPIGEDHFIDTSFEGDTLKVSVGKKLHPSGDDHRITQISLYDEYGDLIEDEFLAIGQEPIVEFDGSLLDDFELRVRCSIHGVWGIKISRD